MKLSSDKVFQESLALGTAGEDIIYQYLIKYNSYVEDNRSKNHKVGTGPRLFGTEGSLVLPDFYCYNKNTDKGNFAIDVKVKNSVYTVKKEKCFTVDNKYEQYIRIVQIKKLDFLMMAFVFENRNYFYRDSECIGTTTFNNQYGTGLVYLFKQDVGKIRY
jgi:hypothetical protein